MCFFPIVLRLWAVFKEKINKTVINKSKLDCVPAFRYTNKNTYFFKSINIFVPDSFVPTFSHTFKVRRATAIVLVIFPSNISLSWAPHHADQAVDYRAGSISWVDCYGHKYNQAVNQRHYSSCHLEEEKVDSGLY